MGNPFQDKFLKAGLASKKQVTEAKRELRVSKKQQRKSKTADPVARIDPEQAAQKQRVNALNQQHNEEQRQRERLAQVRELIEKNRLAKDARGEAYHFVDANKIKRIFVSEEIADQLSRGQAAIVKLGGGYEVVPAKVAHQIANRDQDTVLVLHEGTRDEPGSATDRRG
jgi:hypothetical protein